MEKQPDLNLDIISNLPENVVEKILVHLPVEDAVRTSVLSRKWRFRWASISKLVFKGEHFQNQTDKLVTFIDRVLLARRGPIQKFELSKTSLGVHFATDSWVSFLSRNNVKELKLRFLDVKHEGYKVPSSLFLCQALSSLELFNCILTPPPTFRGFRNLKILHLKNIILHNEEIFESMISNPVLEDLALKFLNRIACLKIRAPNLRSFHFEGYISDLCFVDVPHLGYVYIKLDGSTEISKRFEQSETSHLINVLGGLTGIKKFIISGYFLEFLGNINLPRCFQLPLSYSLLKNLWLSVNFNNLDEILVILCLLKSAPNLQVLHFNVENTDIDEDLDEDIWIAEGQLDCSMNQLSMVRFDCLSGEKNEMEFIKVLLANSPLLDVLTLMLLLNTNIKESMVLKELLGFPRASAKAKIQFSR